MGYDIIQKHYKLNKPYEGYDYVIISATYTSDHGDETYIFGADKKGKILNWSELKNSFTGEQNINKALKKMGYRV